MNNLSLSILLIAILGGCSTAGSHRAELDLPHMNAKIEEARSGDFGEFITEMHYAENQLDKAQSIYDELSKGITTGDDAKDYAIQGHAAASRAIAHRNNAEDAFDRLLSPLQTNIEESGQRLNELESIHILNDVQIPHPDIYFDFAAHIIRDTEKAKLEELLAFLREYPIFGLKLVGYADTVGSKQYNRRLAEHRNQSVIQALHRAGLPSEAIITITVGEVGGLDETRNPKNRRVKIIPYVHGRYAFPANPQMKMINAMSHNEDEQ